jgi:hypothetical protein
MSNPPVMFSYVEVVGRRRLQAIARHRQSVAIVIKLQN